MASNEKALREALEKIVALSVADDYANVCLKNVIADCEEALAKPPRNCDIGTPEEQEERFEEFCNRFRHDYCRGCPLPPKFFEQNEIGKCRLTWAQMPYVEGAAEAESPRQLETVEVVVHGKKAGARV